MNQDIGHSGNVASVQDHGDGTHSENSQCHPGGEDDTIDCFHDALTLVCLRWVYYRASMQRIKHCYTLLHLPIIPGSLGHVLVGCSGSMTLMNP